MSEHSPGRASPTLCPMCDAGVVLYSVPKAGKAELSPERGAGYEPSVLTGELTRVTTVDGWYDKPIHRPYK